MQTVTTAAALRAALAGRTPVALVPTMGNLHEGHLALVRQARTQAGCVVASIFVNPLQFGPNEDYASYPRTFEEDCRKLAAAGCDIVFAPSVAEMYPSPQQVTVNPPPIADELCGTHRPGHFRGVATIVLKLLNLTRPDLALFGKKDFQQLHVVRAMVHELNVPVRIIGGETVRAADGLALSSRNGYLSEAERREAPRLYRELSAVRDAVLAGRRDFAVLTAAAAGALAAAGWQVDYMEVRDAGTLLAPAPDGRHLVALGAARLGATRLIDNIDFTLA